MRSTLARSTRVSFRSAEHGVWQRAVRLYSINASPFGRELLQLPLRAGVPQNSPRRFILPTGCRRFQSSQTGGIVPPNIYNYEDIKKLSLNPDEDKILVDVREPAEVELGFIPTAINIPYKSAPHALSLPEHVFEEQFGFEKPSKEKELIFYCLGGVRSNYAQELAGNFGYDKRGNYPGSWEDWVQKESTRK
ncbi:Rhodanese-like domain-containing protein [Lipomyces tetrasporus]|uniref:Rhodanese-like domain-containing protein n=1 Tax=Lipomyces tetrasporus TaxID=54092 RepID=A0AAD7QTP6_9ASCO|nr:Rhodanese-like domain-containing protein [Lipomyces tetrasporus]KAJ8101322.1 Rhodanese-like domain-containing protein [Lipomyces tetrasporus]